MKSVNYKKYLSVFLSLVCIHSIFVGIGLILIPPSFLEHFGFFNYSESFFQVQAGVFHLGMSIAYGMAAVSPFNSSKLIGFIIYIKFLAFLFLMIYFIFVLSSWMILLSAISDGSMGVITLYLFRLYMKNMNVTAGIQ